MFSPNILVCLPRLWNECEARSNIEWWTMRAIKIVYRINQNRNIQITLKFRLKCLLCFYGMRFFWSVHPWTGSTCFFFLIGFPAIGESKAYRLPFSIFRFLSCNQCFLPFQTKFQPTNINFRFYRNVLIDWVNSQAHTIYILWLNKLISCLEI